MAADGLTDESGDAVLRFVRALVMTVVDRLGDQAPAVRCDRIGFHHGFDDERFEVVLSDEPADDVLIELVIGDPPDHQGAHFTVVAPREAAVAATATHIQDHVLEYTRGALVPPCPDHRHPLHATVVDGVASWACPTDPEHHVEPILPARHRA